MKNYLKELEQISEESARLKKRLAVIRTKVKGDKVETIVQPILDAISGISRDADALIAAGTGKLTLAQIAAGLAPVNAALTDVKTKIEGALTATA